MYEISKRDSAFGESAGAMAVGSLLVADRGKAVQRLKLFRGAIMESGAPSGYESCKLSRLALMTTRPVVESRPHRILKVTTENWPR